MEKEILNTDEVVELTGMAKSYLYKLTSTRQIPHYKPNGKLLFYNKSDVLNYLTRNRVKSNDEIRGEVEEEK
jgi:excisionase family DNA binding protein